jgi:hypothetical protein
MIREAARRLLDVESTSADPAAFEKLVQKARLLEQISTPEEVRRMSDRIRDALNIGEFPAASAEGRAIDFDKAQLISSERVERGDTIEIRERMTDSEGASAEIVYLRRVGPAGRVAYEQIYIEGGRAPVTFDSNQEEFDAAAARQRPFAIINRFPLLQSLHRQAVIPLMDKLAREETPTTQPAAVRPDEEDRS